MNKYKMISISSFITACMFLLSILLPITTIANDKESMELNMQYENSQVTVNIDVSSEIYTGVVCKYLVMDDVLTVNNLLDQVKDEGATINLDKNESGKYTTIVSNVDKRYVVVYVSIGNCNICDYLDCMPNGNQNGKVIERTSHAEYSGTQNSVSDENSANGQDAVVVDNSKTNNNDGFQVIEDKSNNKQTNKTESTQTKQEDTATQVIDLNSFDDTNSANSTATNVDTGSNTVTKQETVVETNKTTNVEQTTTSTKDDTKVSSTNVAGNTTSTTRSNTPAVLDKDSIDPSQFQNIEKTTSTSTVEENMPKTGEDDVVKVLGLIIFSGLSVFSFYKYKVTK